MYEIWLIINTFYELALMNLTLVVVVFMLWLALMLFTGVQKEQPWSRGIKPALLVAVVVWVVSFALIPGMTKSSFANVTYIVDYMVVAGVAAAIAGLVGLFVGPLYLLLKKS